MGFWIHVTPRARTESVAGCQGDALRVAVKAPPVDGKANQARGRRKRVRVHSAPLPLAERLHTLASRP